MRNIDSETHLRGESVYVDDIPVQRGTLHVAVFDSPAAHGLIRDLDVTEAAAAPGVFRVITADDIPGENQIGGIFPDEELLAEREVHFMGQPVALVAADSEEAARAAAAKIKIQIEPLPVVVDPREARAKEMLIHPPRTFSLGDVDKAFENCDHVFEGVAESGGQEHLYIECQGAYCYFTEGGHLRVHSSTQGPTAVQRTVARVLGVPMHTVEVNVTRLGGGFGGKEDQASAWAAVAALVSYVTRRPAKVVLHRMEDLRMTGKRHPYSSDFKIGLSKDYKILAYEAVFHQNAGAAADLSPAVLERTLFHATNSYFIPNVRATAYSCRTHLPPNTAFRGFGGPQGMFVIESALTRAAEKLGVDRAVIQKANLLQDGDEFPYGQIAQHANGPATWTQAEQQFDIEQTRARIEAFNSQNNLKKKGLSVMPICFGISFTKTHMNQAGALVHIYSDGSVAINTAAVEMGQGVNTKMVQVAAQVLSIDATRVRVEPTNTTRVANTSPTAASAGADLNGKAVEIAATALRERLRRLAAKLLDVSVEDVSLSDETVQVKGKSVGWDWEKLVGNAFLNRVDLTEHGYYTTPIIHFDATKEKGHPFAYHVFGAAITEVTLDRVRGTYDFDAVKVVHDFGSSMNPLIDRGQAEGGIVQGIGWMTMEEVAYDQNGRLLSNALSTYKVPDIYACPSEIDVRFLQTEGPEAAILKSKAVGEPPLMYGIGAYFAVRDALRAAGVEGDIPFSAPITPEKVLTALWGKAGRREAPKPESAGAGREQ